MSANRDKGTLLSLDVGTGTVRCVLFDLAGRIVYRETRPRYYLPDPSGDSFLQIFDTAVLWKNICLLTKSMFEKTGVSPDEVLAVSATCQRFSYLFLDGEGRDVYAGPNLDTRGVYTQSAIEQAMGEEYYRITGQWPPLLSALARLLWFREEKPDDFEKIRTVFMLDDWVLYMLSGARTSEASAASGSGLLDVQSASWSRKIMETFDLQADLFPPLKNPGEVAGEVSQRAARETGLAPGTPVVVGGADTQCALLGTGLLGPGRVGIAAGTTGPACLTLDTPLVDPEHGLWTSCHMAPGSWILEANCQWLGNVYQWLHDLLAGLPLQRSVKTDLFGWMEEQAARVPPGTDDSYSFLGPILMDAKAFHVVRPGVFLFPPPAHPMSETPLRIPHLIRSTLENFVFALRGNMDRLRGAGRGEQPDRVFVTGGMAHSALFCRILADCLGIPVEVASIREGSALGAAICAATGVRAFSSIEDAQKGLTRTEQVIEPNREDFDTYDEAFQRWIEVYQKLEDL